MSRMLKRSVSASTLTIALTTCILLGGQASAQGLDANGNDLGDRSPAITFSSSPVPVTRSEAVPFTLPAGDIHWFEVVYLPDGGVNWVQAKGLAEEAGGYLATIHSSAENAFVFSLIADNKFWHRFDKPYNDWVLSGPFIGGFQPAGAAEPDGGWQWVSGEDWTFELWQKEGLDIGINFPPDDQPNNSNDNQNVLAFGEVDYPVSYWGDVPHMMGTHGTPAPPNHGFIIEYENRP